MKSLFICAMKPPASATGKIVKGIFEGSTDKEFQITGAVQTVFYLNREGKPVAVGSNVDGVTTRETITINRSQVSYHTVVENEQLLAQYEKQISELRLQEAGMVLPKSGGVTRGGS